MDKQHHHHLRLYSFRSRMMSALYVCTILSSIISLLFAYVISHVNVQNELKLQQQTIGLYLLEMSQRTEMPLNVIMNMVNSGDVVLTTTPLEGTTLPQELMNQLKQTPIVTMIEDMADTPETYVLIGGTIIRIAATQGRSLFIIAFLRVIFSAVTYMAVFALMITFASFRLSRPVQKLTIATSRVQEGDFTVRLPDSVSGEMGELMRSFNSMTEALGRTSYLQKDFISSISHEFKTPIASIRGFAKLLQMPGITEEQRAEYIALIAQESDRLSRLSETLLRLTALEQQTAGANVSRFALDEQLRQVILRLEPSWSPKDILWQPELDSVMIETDEALLSHVWINLIQNAVKFSPQEGAIEVKLTAKDGCAYVSITDHGCGMDAEALTRIFDRFYQADKSHNQEGVGLGLCLVKRILDMLGGHVAVTSVPGEGSTFTVTLPLTPPRQEEKLHA